MLQGLRIVFFILFFPLQKFCSEAYVGENVKSLVLSELQQFCAAIFFFFPIMAGTNDVWSMLRCDN